MLCLLSYTDTDTTDIFLYFTSSLGGLLDLPKRKSKRRILFLAVAVTSQCQIGLMRIIPAWGTGQGDIEPDWTGLDGY